MNAIIIVFLILMTLISAALPFILNIIANNFSVNSAADFSSWLGFLGSYLGALISSFTVVVSVLWTFKLGEKDRIRQLGFEKIDYLLILITLINELLNDIDEKQSDIEWTVEKKEKWSTLMSEIIKINGKWAEGLTKVYLLLVKLTKQNINGNDFNLLKKELRKLKKTIYRAKILPPNLS